VGICCKDQAGRRELAFQANLLQQVQGTTGNLVRSIAQDDELFFEVRPDRIHSEAGPESWIYEQAYRNPGFMVRRGGLQMPRLAAGAGGLEWPVTIRVRLPFPLRIRPEAAQLQNPKPFLYDFQVYLCDHLPPGTLRLGKSFLRHGITVWQQDVTHFIPLADNQEAHACRFNRLRT
jgi:hypothetical protein